MYIVANCFSVYPVHNNIIMIQGDVESVCTVFLHGLYKSSQLLAKGENVSFTLPANIQYNTSFIITNAAIRSGIVSHIVFSKNFYIITFY